MKTTKNMEEKDNISFVLIKGIKKANNQILKQEYDIVKEYNLTTSQYGVLECLYIKGNMCINELIERLISTSGTMTVIIKNLEKMGYIIRESKCDDRRSYNIVLTEKGRDIVKKILPKRKKQANDFANTLSKEEQEEFINLLYKFKKRYKVVKDEKYNSNI